jgi:hypothetical protein
VWNVEAVETTGDVGRAASLALDANDHPHIAHWDATAGVFEYVTR